MRWDKLKDPSGRVVSNQLLVPHIFLLIRNFWLWDWLSFCDGARISITSKDCCMVKSHCTRLNSRWIGTILEEREVLKRLHLNLEKKHCSVLKGRHVKLAAHTRPYNMHTRQRTMLNAACNDLFKSLNNWKLQKNFWTMARSNFVSLELNVRPMQCFECDLKQALLQKVVYEWRHIWVGGSQWFCDK